VGTRRHRDKRIRGVNLTGWKLLRFAGPTGAQPLFAAVFNEGPPTPPVDGEGEFRVEWRYDQVAETTFAREATTEVTDARGQLTIRKQNQNHEPLDGALFNIRIDFSDGTHQQIDGWETYNGGRLLTWNHPPGNIDPAIVTITEVRAPQHYSINADNQRVVTVSPSYTLWEHVQFWEETMTTTTAWWVVLRITEDGDEVEVDRWQDGPVSHERNRSPWNRHSTADSVVGDLHQSVTFINQRISGQLIVYKRCAVTGQLLQGAEFRVEGVDLGNTGTYNQTGVTGPDGSVTFNSLFPGTYMVTEVRAPHTHNTDAPPQTTAIQSNETVRLTFENTRRQGLNILKVDPDGNPLQGAVFEVRRGSGQVLGSYITDVNGLIIIPSHYLTTGYYLAEEIQAPDGFIIDRENNPQTIWIDNSQQNQTYSLVFRNFRMPSLEIIKVDTNDGRPLLGAAFRITEANGRFVGEHTTGPDGLITLTGLPPGVYTVSEIRAADGYILDLTPQIVTLEAGKTHRLEFRNTAIPGLQLIKLCSETGRPVEGAIFDVVELQGGFRKSLGTFTTGANGTFFIPGLSLGHYVTTEVKAAPGYILDPAPQNIFVQGGRINVVTVYNTPYSNLRLLKICSETRDPLEGAVFRLFDDKRRELGTFTTSVLGEIHLTQLPGGTYFIQEVRAPAGYLLDNTVRQIELIGGKTTIVEVPNKELGSLRIIKRCAEDGRPLYGATFLLYDTRNNLLGEFRTDQNGSIVFGSNLAAGTYRIREIRAPEGYVLDETLRTVTVREGETTEIVVENAPIRGRIQIVKKAADDNPITRQRAGALLEGAEFEIYDRNLNVVDTITTDINGIAISINLPLGTYAVRETKSPTGFFTDGAVFYAEIKIHNDMVRFEVLNQSKDLSVMVEKRGNVEVIAGDEMKYDFSNIANTSNVPLYNFYWHDQLPADSVRLGTIHTGTWSESLTYNVTYRTNLRTSYRPLASNLSSRTSHTLDATPAALRLAANEYITDIRFEFGTVSPGFREVEAPSFIVNTLANIPNGHRIVNRTEVGGRDGGAEVTARDQWVTISLSKPKGALPRTGW